MLVNISNIKINPGRREVRSEDVEKLSKSMSEVGLLNPITITPGHILIAGNHRLEAAKILGWTEIECTVCDVSGLLAELAEIDENFVRKNLSPIEFGDLLLRRKEIYEELHPETKAGNAQAAGMNKAVGNNVAAKSATTLSFVEDTATKIGISPRTVRERIQTAKNLTPKAKNIIQRSDTDITKTDALKLSRLEPEQQEEAATQLSTGEISSVDEYKKPYSLGGKRYATFEESVADLKNADKDASYTPDTLLAGLDGFIDSFNRDFAWYSMPMCTEVFPKINQEQYDYIKERFAGVISDIEELLRDMERSMNSEEKQKE
ncbi:MAG: ParB N-terminal domain-containing protein [Lachnospiraceae bacterium]|nr:ParB N-terminal domain-containing protein [Lachnospiraceae bacterium]